MKAVKTYCQKASAMFKGITQQETSKSSNAVPAGHFNIQSYYTYLQQNRINFIYLWVFSMGSMTANREM
jgi:hypothetical protein